MQRLLLLTLFVLSAGFGFAHGAHAQVGGTQIPLTLDLDPAYPGPYDTVLVTPDSTQFDLSGAKTVLYVNGKQTDTGTGATPFSVPMQGPGVAVTVDVKATLQGATYDASATLHPEQVSLVLEPNSITHPFYEGMPLLASEGRARIVAVPDLRTGGGTRLDPSTLVYQWKLGDQELQPQSGVGRSVLSLTGPVRYRDATVLLTVMSQDNSLVAQRAVKLSASGPSVQIYRNDPLLGPLYNAVIGDSYTMTGTEDGFLVVPYFFSSAPALDWQVNGNESGTDPFITVRATGSGSGDANLSVSATGDTSFDTGNAETTISFSSSGSSGTFGI